ncbi:glutamate synthase subunit beta [Desulfonema ishimotonii]|uniref:Glutamate synthase subunit beta n=1 Tax=Desulfonema ishimotonii TaxID=45657 RepID=A0A401FUU2_9BACT|nr:glutamate synthase subunit beta [Desulfonema ishimotonii]GBC60736.1 glutamate synthase subunit beta [Desulfonema ishimotonii]
MGKITGFKEFTRILPRKRPVEERIRDYREIYLPFPKETLISQAARCMDCGVPTCHSGCPLGNLIPDWNDRVYRGQWRDAIRLLHRTNNFPEFTGRLCPAPCEEACVLAISEPAVTIEQIEKEIIEYAFEQGWVVPEPPARRTGKTVAVIGSGPAGLACAQQLNRAGHTVTVFERDDRSGGLLRYGIPDFKMDKGIIDRRLAILEAEGIGFRTGVHVGTDVTAEDLADFNAVVICVGATRPRDMAVPGRELDGVHFAMAYLTRQNRRVAGDDLAVMGISEISAAGKNVVVIGGGDTSSDCIGNCARQGAKQILNFIKYPEPPEARPEDQPWPCWPDRLRTTPSHEEGCERHWGLMAKAFVGHGGRVENVITLDLRPQSVAGRKKPVMKPVPGTERTWPADLVLLAIGFEGPETDTLVTQYGLTPDEQGNIRTDASHMSDRPGVFAAGDASMGASLIVWAISEGREAARSADIYLMGRSALPTRGPGDLPPCR